MIAASVAALASGESALNQAQIDGEIAPSDGPWLRRPVPTHRAHVRSIQTERVTLKTTGILTGNLITTGKAILRGTSIVLT